MNKEKLNSQRTVAVYEIDRCPECLHFWTDFGECHFHDCRYFWFDQEGDTEESNIEGEIVVRPVPNHKTAAATEDRV
jgi:hypothetical protein